TVNGGVVIAHGASSPEEGIDADNLSYLTFNGGVIFSSGGAMQQGSSGPRCKQSCEYISGSLSKGYFTVTDASKNVIMSVYVPRAMSQNYSYVSSPDLTKGSTYYYGTQSSAPSNPTDNFSTYYYAGGTVSSLPSSSFSATGGYATVGSSSGGSYGPGR
ncbi:MAG: hypothetical protein K5984_03445, partial [Bacteroidales bacterium]|nr:hypothetical protein [Bacteroidales bacterium]